MKKLFVMLMMALPVVSFTACSSSDDDEPPVENPTLAEIAAGTYDVTVEVSGLEEETPEAFAALAEQPGGDGEKETFELKIEGVKGEDKKVNISLEKFVFEGNTTVSNLEIKDAVLEAISNSTVSTKFENGQKVSATGEMLVIGKQTFDGTIESGNVQVANEAKKLDLTLKLDISKVGAGVTPENDNDDDDDEPIIITVKISGYGK